ncbi:MAG TPA: hypothetical protein VGO00_24770, partial [Kofleriaceae bacterium]|nr:hypothetical protein [Kofleriaceae bacterium]
METWLARGFAAASLAWLALTGVVYLVVFVNGRRREHGWLALQSLLAATYSLWVLDPSVAGATTIGVLGGALCVACAASVAFTHTHFGLPSPGRVWAILAGLGVVAGILTRVGWVPAHAMAAVTLLVIAAALTHQIDSLRRLARTPTPSLNARVLMAAWIVLALAIAVDVASWLADLGAFGEPARLSASIV